MKTFWVSGAALLALPFAAWAQGPVSGRVMAATVGAVGQPLAGVTVQLDGQAVAATDADGRFVLPAVPAGSHRLQLSYVGFAPLEQTIEGSTAPQTLQLVLRDNPLLTEAVTVTATRANERTATAYTTITKEELARRNFGQDLPYLLDQTPSVVVSSDAGAGVGYTGIRVRGTDVAGINVTINGVPLNDAESHGAFFVNLPDLATSASSVQVQRGVGTSQNGGAAFGASLNIGTLELRREAYAESQNTVGSFDTWKNNVSFGTGLLGGRFTVDGRLSRINSDGYVQRAASELKSYYLAAGFQQQRTLLKFITFSGREKTYQAWNGVPEAVANNDRQGILDYINFNYITGADSVNLLSAGRRYNGFTYDNQTDNYQQNHYQLHLSQAVAGNWTLGGALHLTRGFGYYEEYKPGEKLADYNIPPLTLGDTTIGRTDLVRRKWLDNYFYGATYALTYQPPADDRLTATLGGGWNRYDGDHYGEVIWARYAASSAIRHRYYFNDARKTDFNTFLKATWQLSAPLSVFGDLQLRRIDYRIQGRDDDQRDVSTRADYAFFNPKAGLTYAPSETHTLYASVAVGQREPVRTDFTDRPATDAAARAERLTDWEAGYRLRLTRPDAALTGLRAELNGFFMNYRNQLVATGQLNDVGTPLRTNIARSYRAGVELSGAAAFWRDCLTVSANLTLSENRLRDFREQLYVYDADYNVREVREAAPRRSTISYSPAVVSGSTVEGQPLKNLRVAVLYKTVSRQFLDNSASNARSLPAYQVADLRLRYTLRSAWLREIELALLVNNLFNREYAANGYTYGAIYADRAERRDFNFVYPQATRNFLASVGVKL